MSMVSADKVEDHIVSGLELIQAVLPNIQDTEERATLAALKGQFERIQEAHRLQQAAVENYLERAESGEANEALRITPEIQEAQTQLHTEIGQVSSRIDSATQRVSDRTTRAQKRAVLVSGFLALIALVFGSMMLILAVVSLRPITRLTSEVQRIAGGDYAARTEINRSDELGILASEINTMAASIEARDEALRTRAEELDAVLNAIRLGLVVVDGQGVALANPAAIDLWDLRLGAPLPTALLAASDREEALPLGERFLLCKSLFPKRLHSRRRRRHSTSF